MLVPPPSLASLIPPGQLHPGVLHESLSQGLGRGLQPSGVLAVCECPTLFSTPKSWIPGWHVEGKWQVLGKRVWGRAAWEKLLLGTREEPGSERSPSWEEALCCGLRGELPWSEGFGRDFCVLTPLSFGALATATWLWVASPSQCEGPLSEVSEGRASGC